MTNNINTYYLNNRDKMINQSLKSYYKQIGNMNETELKEYRKVKAQYFKQWYQKNKIYIREKNNKRYISKPKKEVTLRPRRKQCKKLEYEYINNCGSINFSE